MQVHNACSFLWTEYLEVPSSTGDAIKASRTNINIEIKVHRCKKDLTVEEDGRDCNSRVILVTFNH